MSSINNINPYSSNNYEIYRKVTSPHAMINIKEPCKKTPLALHTEIKESLRCSESTRHFLFKYPQFLYLFRHTDEIEIRMGQKDISFYNVSDVGMDKVLVIDASEGHIGTSHCGPCIAICARGLTQEGSYKLGITHSSGIFSARKYLDQLKIKMIHSGAIEKTINFYCVGGSQASHTMEQQLIILAKEYNIKRVCFCLSQSEDENSIYSSVHVVITPNTVVYSYFDLFTVNPDGVGDYIQQ